MVNSLTAFLTDLLEYVNGSLTAPAQRKVVSPGVQVAVDNPCGQISVNVVRATPLFVRGNSCPNGYEVVAAIQVHRCVTGMSDNGEPPSSLRVTNDGQENIRDMVEVGRAVQCYEVPDAYQRFVRSLEPVSYRGLGPEGDVAGGEWQIRIRVNTPWQP